MPCTPFDLGMRLLLPNIDFQPQILKKAGASLHLAPRPFSEWLCIGTDWFSEQVKYLEVGF